MVQCHSDRYGTSGSHPNSMGSKYLFAATESVRKMEVPLFAFCVVCNFRIYVSSLINFRLNFFSIGIDADTEDTAFAVVAIEGNTRLGARADIANEHVVKEEG